MYLSLVCTDISNNDADCHNVLTREKGEKQPNSPQQALLRGRHERTGKQASMEIEVEAAAAASSLRLSEIESAHLCPSARAKMEELFSQWLNADGTRDMIHAVVADVRAGKALDAVLAQYAALAAINSSGSGSPHVPAPPPPPSSSDGSSPARSPKRPPNYQQHFGSSSSSSPNSRKKHLVVSLFGDELHGTEQQPQQTPTQQQSEKPDVVMKEGGESDAQLMDTDSNNDGDEGVATTEDSATEALGHLRKQIPKLYTPGEGRRGRLRGLSTDSISRKIVRGAWKGTVVMRDVNADGLSDAMARRWTLTRASGTSRTACGSKTLLRSPRTSAASRLSSTRRSSDASSRHSASRRRWCRRSS